MKSQSYSLKRLSAGFVYVWSRPFFFSIYLFFLVGELHKIFPGGLCGIMASVLYFRAKDLFPVPFVKARSASWRCQHCLRSVAIHILPPLVSLTFPLAWSSRSVFVSFFDHHRWGVQRTTYVLLSLPTRRMSFRDVLFMLGLRRFLFLFFFPPKCRLCVELEEVGGFVSGSGERDNPMVWPPCPP